MAGALMGVRRCPPESAQSSVPSDESCACDWWPQSVGEPGSGGRQHAASLSSGSGSAWWAQLSSSSSWGRARCKAHQPDARGGLPIAQGPLRRPRRRGHPPTIGTSDARNQAPPPTVEVGRGDADGSFRPVGWGKRKQRIAFTWRPRPWRQCTLPSYIRGEGRIEGDR